MGVLNWVPLEEDLAIAYFSGIVDEI